MKTLLASATLLTLSLTACMPATSTAMTKPSEPAMMMAKMSTYSGMVSGSNEMPAVASSVSGTVTLTLNEEAKTAQVTGMVMNLSAAPVASHIHAPALKGANGPVLKPLTYTASGTNMYTISGGFNLTDAEIADLKAKKFYFNIHTPTNPGGEGRAQLE